MYRLQEKGYGLSFIQRTLEQIGVKFLKADDQMVAALRFTLDNGLTVPGRDNRCMNLASFKEKFILVKAPLGSGKSYQARQMKYKRVCWLTSSRALANETSSRTGFTNYQEIGQFLLVGLIISYCWHQVSSECTTNLRSLICS